jgi:hypothetical protein
MQEGSLYLGGNNQVVEGRAWDLPGREQPGGGRQSLGPCHSAQQPDLPDGSVKAMDGVDP